MALGKSTPQQPATPNPQQVAQAQTGTNVQTAIANSVLGNANEITPYGSVTYNQIGSTHVPGATMSGSGSAGGGLFGLGADDPRSQFKGGAGGPFSTQESGYNIPQFERRVTLSPEQQKLYEQQTQLGGSLNQLAIDQTGRLSNVLGQPISANGLPAGGQMPGQGPQFQGIGGGPQFSNVNLQQSIGPTDYSADRRRVEEAIYSRLNPQLNQDRDALENRLVNQGLTRGSDAFRQEMDASNRQATDARMQAILAGGGEQSRLANLALQSGQFANQSQLAGAGFNNAALQQGYQNQTGATQYGNELAQRGFGNQMELAQARDTQRERALQEQLAMRNQPINEISALMSGGQVQAPNFAQYKGGQVANTPIGDYMYNSAALQNQRYQQQQQQQNAMMGGLFGLGGSLLQGAGAAGGFTPLFRGLFG